MKIFLFSPFLIDRWEQNAKLEIIYRIFPFSFSLLGSLIAFQLLTLYVTSFISYPPIFFPVNLKGLFLNSSALKFHGGVP